MNKKWLAIKQLDRQLKEWQTVARQFQRPRGGWVKTLREALNMTAEQLANRLNLSRARIVQLENAEIHDAITVRSLKEAANALECEFIYAIIPKDNNTLENIVKTRAEKIAHERIKNVAHTMALENQAVNKNLLKTEEDELAKSIAEAISKNIWLQDNPSNTTLADSIAKMLIENQPKKKK